MEKCNCGRDAKYMKINEDGTYDHSCNKYSVCKTYSELEEELKQTKEDYKEILRAATDFMDYLESSEQHKKAVKVVLKHRYSPERYEDIAKFLNNLGRM